LAKGIEINMIALIIIGLVGIAVLLMILYGPISSMLKSTFCFFYEDVLKQKADFCAYTKTIAQQVTICKTKVEECTHVAEGDDEIANYIAAYSILCWQEANVKVTKNTICYQIILKTHPYYIDEEFFTYNMEKGNGCEVLENSKIILPDGEEVEYSGYCGTHDNIFWDVSNNVIKKQSLILIKYDTVENKIIISA